MSWKEEGREEEKRRRNKKDRIEKRYLICLFLRVEYLLLVSMLRVRVFGLELFGGVTGLLFLHYKKKARKSRSCR